MRSLYGTLGVDRRATAKEIKRAYYAAAHDCHPDKFPDDPERAQRFRDISLAYTVLGDPHSRKRYDLLGPMALGLSPSLTDLSVLGREGEQLAQALGSVVGGVMSRLRRRKTKSLAHIDVHIDVATALRGGTQELHMERKVVCPECGGHKKVVEAAPAAASHALTARCPTCGGTGFMAQKVTWRLRIPSDSGPGDVLRMHQAGSMGEDLLVRLVIDPHPHIRCRGLDLYIDLPVRPSNAALGDPITVHLPHKILAIKLPEGSQTGDLITVTGEGLRAKKGKRGKLHLTLEVEMPTALNEEARKAWAAVARSEQQGAAQFPRYEAFARSMHH